MKRSMTESDVSRTIRLPAEGVYAKQAQTTEDGEDLKVMVDLRAEAKPLGLCNLFLSDEKWGAGLSNLEIHTRHVCWRS